MLQVLRALHVLVPCIRIRLTDRVRVRIRISVIHSTHTR